MNARLVSPTGSARQLGSGGWVVDLGDLPQWVPDRAAARKALGLSLVSPVGLFDGPSSSRAARPGFLLIDP